MDFHLSAVSQSVGRYATISRLSPPNNPKHMNPQECQVKTTCWVTPDISNKICKNKLEMKTEINPNN